MANRYRVHRFDVKMTTDQEKLENFLNNLTGDVVAIIPNVTSRSFEYASIDFLLIVERNHLARRFELLNNDSNTVVSR